MENAKTGHATLPFTKQDLNYIRGSLRSQIKAHERQIKAQEALGNTAIADTLAKMLEDLRELLRRFE